MITPDRIAGAIAQLPTLSTVATRLWSLTRDERSSVADFEAVIRPDPALTANLLRYANSAWFAPRSRAESVRQAVVLLGVKRVCEVATLAAAARVVPPRLPGYGLDALGFWQHCVAVAVLSERLSGELGLRPPDLTFTAGLLHDIGKLAICSFVADQSDEILSGLREGLSFVSAERRVLGLDHAEIGAAVARAWNLPPQVADVAAWHHDPGRAPDSVDRALVDLVHVADGLAQLVGFGNDVGELAREIDRGTRQRLGLKVQQLERAAGDCLEPIREMGALFAPAGGPR
ncbi:HDOD domain-containing protein [Anaeromyxobacter paludicola]|uniref:HDOD domain-containing protein n=1 Tax=Anaeromyxobacter paludicola TaxID=2918171 RepID=A0ABM7X842_9BACT|nr:HDOD domain-containing protein [Anaeromyxobacter paludicola]BDG07982.1 hypothetical protein AMPC_10950 [Anaeromyxobacter paludicola]